MIECRQRVVACRASAVGQRDGADVLGRSGDIGIAGQGAAVVERLPGDAGADRHFADQIGIAVVDLGRRQRHRFRRDGQRCIGGIECRQLVVARQTADAIAKRDGTDEFAVCSDIGVAAGGPAVGQFFIGHAGRHGYRATQGQCVVIDLAGRESDGPGGDICAVDPALQRIVAGQTSAATTAICQRQRSSRDGLAVADILAENASGSGQRQRLSIVGIARDKAARIHIDRAVIGAGAGQADRTRGDGHRAIDEAEQVAVGRSHPVAGDDNGTGAHVAVLVNRRAQEGNSDEGIGGIIARQIAADRISQYRIRITVQAGLADCREQQGGGVAIQGPVVGAGNGSG